MSGKLKVALYGNRGHQIKPERIQRHEKADLAGISQFPPKATPSTTETSFYETLEDILNDDSIDFVSLCSPRRREQAQHAVRCMEAGKHVYAEKPCAMTEEDLDAIIDTSKRTGKHFHEMADTAFHQPYYAMRQLVKQGTVGEVVQVLAQKSYPYHQNRPQDEDVDGGLLLQAGVHAIRFIEHVAGLYVNDLQAVQTRLSNPEPGNLKMAVSLYGTLANGGVTSVLCNYLNFKSFPTHGNETLRIFGTTGFVETTDGGTRTRLVTQEKDEGEIDSSVVPLDFFDTYLDEVLGEDTMPLSLEDEVHPTRMLIRARNEAREAM